MSTARRPDDQPPAAAGAGAPSRTPGRNPSHPLMNTAARRLAALTAAALAGLAMLVSFRALADLAERWHALPEGLGWALPVMLDGLAVAGGVAALARRLDGHRALYPWTVVLLGAAASLAGNVSHAPGATGARIVAAAPPLVAALALHLAMEEARRRGSTPTTAPLVPEPRSAASLPTPGVPEPAAPLPLPVPPPVPLPDPSHEEIDGSGSARDRARRYLERNPGPITGTELATRIGTSDSYARRMLGEFRPPATAGANGANGNGAHAHPEGS